MILERLKIFTKPSFRKVTFRTGSNMKRRHVCNILCLKYIFMFVLAVAVYPLHFPKHFFLTSCILFLDSTPNIRTHQMSQIFFGRSLFIWRYSVDYYFRQFSFFLSLCVSVTAHRLFSIMHILSDFSCILIVSPMVSYLTFPI